jgi:hypothetical protein
MRIRLRGKPETIAAARRWVVAATLLLAAAPSARAQNPMFEQFREECRQQYAYLRGPGQQQVVAEHVQACVREKIAAQAHNAEAAPAGSDQPIRLSESTAWLIGPNKGPAQAKGVVYFVAGYSPGRPMIDGFRMVPYFLKSMADDGWDVVRAKLPSDLVGPMLGVAYVGRGAQTIRERAAELKAQGYKRVVAGGHSWGAWAAMLAAGNGGAIDAVVLSAPNTFGPRLNLVNGAPNPNFPKIVSEFAPALAADKIPTVLILPDDNVWDADPAARGQIAEQYFAQARIPHLVIAKPPGFFGHYAGWLPVFDYAYGACVRAFLANPTASPTCAPPPLVNTDFRSITSLTQIPDAAGKRIVSAAPLVGRRFVAYTLQNVDNKHFDYVAPDQRVTMLSDQEVHEQVAFRDGRQCAGQTCGVLEQWSDHEILEFDPESGGIKAWWTEDTSRR